MKKYLGVKLIEAEPMKLGDYNTLRGWKIPENEDPEREGYKIVYPNVYVSWSPKEVFETTYMHLENNNNTITQKDVENYIAKYEDFKFGEKTTVVKATLVNGFEIVESSSCVDVANFNQDIGINICLKRIENKVWELLGFLLQTGKKSI